MAYVHTPELLIARQNASLSGYGPFRTVDVLEDYNLTLDCFQPGAAMTFSLYRSAHAQSPWSVLLKGLARCGAPFQFRLDGALVLSGFLDEVDEAVDRGGARITVSGKDIGGIAREFDADPTLSFQGLNLEDAMRRLYATLGIQVVFTPDAAVREAMSRPTRLGGTGTTSARQSHRRKVVNRVHPNAGEKVWELADSFATRAGLFQCVAPVEALDTMAVVLYQPNYTADPFYAFTRTVDITDDSVEGNIQRGSHRTSTRAMPTRVRVFAHAPRGDAAVARFRADVPQNDLLLDTDLTAQRVYIPHPRQPRYVKSRRARSQEEAAQEAERVYARAAKGLRTYTAQVQGHSQEFRGTRRLYVPNTVAEVTDDVLGIRERMYIHRVQYQGGRKGTSTVLTMIPVNAVKLFVGVVQGESVVQQR